MILLGHFVYGGYVLLYGHHGHVVSGNVEHGVLLVDRELLLPAAAQLLMSKLGYCLADL